MPNCFLLQLFSPLLKASFPAARDCLNLVNRADLRWRQDWQGPAPGFLVEGIKPLKGRKLKSCFSLAIENDGGAGVRSLREINVRNYFLAAILMSFSSLALGGYVSGNELKTHLDDYEKDTGSAFNSGAYAGYVTGVYDTLEGLAVCAPSSVTRGQIADIVGNYIKANPEILHKSGSIVIFQALSQAFPCKK